MGSIDQPAPPLASADEPHPAPRLRGGRSARRSLPFGAYLNSEFQTLVKPEDVARGEVFFNSTWHWI